MASSPITLQPIDGKNVETVSDFIFLGSKINAVTAVTKLKDTGSFGGKAMTKLDSVLKSTLLTKVHIVKTMVF